MRDRPAVPTVGHAGQAEYLSGDAQDVSRAVHGGAAKAVYGYPLEHYAFWREELEEELPLGAFGENLTVEVCRSRRRSRLGTGYAAPTRRCRNDHDGRIRRTDRAGPPRHRAPVEGD
jgi:hypothetical protein